LCFQAKVRHITNRSLVIGLVPISAQSVQMVPNGLSRSLRAALERINHDMVRVKARNALTLQQQQCACFPKCSILGAADGRTEPCFFLTWGHIVQW